MPDYSKPRWDLLPIIPIEEASKVMTFGESKYGPGAGWSELPVDAHYAALMRHLVAWKKANDHGHEDLKYDAESGLHHLAHVIVRASFVMEVERAMTVINDS